MEIAKEDPQRKKERLKEFIDGKEEEEEKRK